MRLEDVTSENVAALGDQELRDLLERATQVYKAGRAWADQLRQSMVGVGEPHRRPSRMDGGRLADAYGAVQAELAKRGLPVPAGPEAARILGRRLRGVDVADLPPVVVRESVVALGGEFADAPGRARSVGVYVDADGMADSFADALEARLVAGLADQTGRPVVASRDPLGLGERVIPAYDLVLVPRPETAYEPAAPLAKRLAAAKAPVGTKQAPDVPTPTPGGKSPPRAGFGGPAAVVKFVPQPLVAELRPTADFAHLETMRDKFGPGIHGVWGNRDGKDHLQAVVFDDLPEAEARGWLLGRGLRAELARVPAEPEAAAFIKSEEERIVGGVVYGLGSVEKADAQGDFVDDIKEIWEGLKSWMIGTGGTMKIYHEGRAVSTPVVECFLAEADTVKGGRPLRKGDWWLTVHVPGDYDELWQGIKAGEITGFSMGGRGQAEAV